MGNQAIEAAHTQGETRDRDRIDPSDAAEREAERVADAAVNGTGSDSTVTPSRQPWTIGAGRTATGAVEPGLQSLPGGRPLRPAERSFVESRIGGSIPAVRVHTGPVADRVARYADAAALTFGRDIVFSNRAYEPGSVEGRQLLAHEIGHAAQQRGGDPVVQRQSDDDKNQKTAQQASLEAQLLVTTADLGDLRDHPFVNTSKLDERVRQHVNSIIERAIRWGVRTGNTDKGVVIEKAWKLAHADREAADPNKPEYALHVAADHYLHSRDMVANTWRTWYMWDVAIGAYDVLKGGLQLVGQLDVLKTGSQPVSKPSYWISSWAQLGADHGSEDF